MPSLNPQKHSTDSSFFLVFLFYLSYDENGISGSLTRHEAKRYSGDMPEVGLDIVLKSAEIADHGTKLGASTERERTVTISLLNNSTYFVCHLTVQIQLLLHFKYIYSCYMNYNSYSVSRVLECYRMPRPVFRWMTIVNV